MSCRFCVSVIVLIDQALNNILRPQDQEGICSGKNVMLVTVGLALKQQWQQLRSIILLPRKLLEGFSQG